MPFKVVFRDDYREKVAVGTVDFTDPDLVKVTCRDGVTIYINKRNIVFMREL